MNKYYLNHIDELEAEAIFILREVASKFDNPVLLFSGGKDSIVLTRLAEKAFYPAQIPLKLLHVDTGHNFPETLEFRDNLISEMNLDLVVGYVQDSINKDPSIEEKGSNASRNSIQTITLLEMIDKYKFDVAIGGARRDEEKSRAKERFFSHRDEFGQWSPKNQRPELWSLFNSYKYHGEHFRVFPLSNWTELDVWNYINKEELELPSLYFSHKRDCIIRDNMILAKSDYVKLKESDQIKEMTVRYRTCGDMTITGAIESTASNTREVINEISLINTTERGTRADDKRSESAMEDRKITGYF
ncbi:sulfate adenylyltransferase subunit 2 [Flavobacteriaceae bacterium]|nr:sulfate adenylyltransferase subunit 2 [Flavobacteriaceae bacterium]